MNEEIFLFLYVFWLAGWLKVVFNSTYLLHTSNLRETVTDAQLIDLIDQLDEKTKEETTVSFKRKNHGDSDDDLDLDAMF